MAFFPTEKENANFQQFVEDLTALSKKYNVAIKSIGGVTIYPPNEDLSDIAYSIDSSSGDLTYEFTGV